MKKVFLGGTVNKSTWRDEIIKMLQIDYFNPVVETWTDEAYQQELYERENCDFCLYVLTPKMTGYYSVAEVVDDSNKRPEKTVICILQKDMDNEFTPFQLKSLNAITKMVSKNGAKVCKDLKEVAEYLNFK
ncbi:MAG: hypothetical protein HC831_20080 [Chloroflexia bacterium]|nr:hypothetical protein [Chloroflexia bacterium]